MLEPLSGFSFLQPAPRRRYAQPAVPLPEEEEASLLSKGMGALTWLGESLDKPGLALRGALAGKPEQLLNLIPFSDFLGITSEQGKWHDTLGVTHEADRVYGRDLLEAYGAPRNRSGFRPLADTADAAWDVAGLGAEVLLDPLWLVGGPAAALTKAGREVAQGAKFAKGAKGVAEVGSHIDDVLNGVSKTGRILGTSPAAMADEIREGYRGLLSLRIPIVQKNPFYVLGAKSERAAKAVEAWNYGQYAPMRGLRSMFSKTVGGILDPVAQAARDKAFSQLVNLNAAIHVGGGVLSERLPVLENLWADIWPELKDLDPAVKEATTGFANASQVMDYLVEAKEFVGKAFPEMKQQVAAMFDKTVPEVEAFADEVLPMVDVMTKAKDAMFALHKELGGRGEWLDSTFVAHFPRGIRREYAKIMQDSLAQRLLPTGIPAASQRNFVFDVPGGKVTINRITRDPKVVGWARKADNAVAGAEDPVGLLRGAVGQLYMDDDVAEAFSRVGGLWDEMPESIKHSVHPTSQKKLARYEWFDLSKSEQANVMRELKVDEDVIDRFLTSGPDVKKMDMKSLQGHYIWKKYLAPELDKALQRGMPLETHQAAKEKMMRGLDLGDEAILGQQEMARAAVDPEAIARAPLPSEAVAPAPAAASKAPYTAADKAAKAAAARGEKAALEEQPVIPALVDYLGKLPDEVLETGLFNRTSFEDWMDYSEHLAVSIANLKSIHSLLDNVMTLRKPGQVAEEGKEDWVTLSQAWDNVRTQGGHGGPALDEEGLRTAVKHYAAKNNITDLPTLLPNGGPNSILNPEDFRSIADHIYVDPRTSEAMSKYLDIETKKGQGTLGKLYSMYTAGLKFGVTLPWPAFSVRNFADGQWRNIARVGNDTYSLGSLVKAMWNFSTKHGKVDELPHFREFLDAKILEGQAAAQVESLAKAEGTKLPSSLLDALVEPVKASYPHKYDPNNLIGWRGVWSNTKVEGRQWLPAEMGSRVHQYVEFANRYVPFAAAMDSGMDAAQAAHLVREIQFDYGRKAGGALKHNFSDDVMKKIFPFWSFTSNNIPYQLRQLFNRPGGGHAQTLRFINQAQRANEGYVPEWMKERVSVRVGGDDENARFIRQFGLSIEDLAKFQPSLMPAGIFRTASRLIADMNPLITTPVKWWTGKDPYSGRNVKDLNSPTENYLGRKMPFTDSVLMATPASRGVTTLEMLLDPRTSAGLKALNFATGVKVGTYDLPLQKAYELERANKAIIEQDPVGRAFETMYVPKAKRDKATPKTLEAVARSARLAALIKKLNEERKPE